MAKKILETPSKLHASLKFLGDQLPTPNSWHQNLESFNLSFPTQTPKIFAHSTSASFPVGGAGEKWLIDSNNMFALDHVITCM